MIYWVENRVNCHSSFFLANDAIKLFRKVGKAEVGCKKRSRVTRVKFLEKESSLAGEKECCEMEERGGEGKRRRRRR